MFSKHINNVLSAEEGSGVGNEEERCTNGESSDESVWRHENKS